MAAAAAPSAYAGSATTGRGAGGAASFGWQAARTSAVPISSTAREPERFTKPPDEVRTERSRQARRALAPSGAGPARTNTVERGRSKTVADSNTHLYLNAKMNPKGSWC
ncbi:hypothetical protein BDI4_560091 [Burkholderia diffusa]|nr:hypothetical protein BDI4_560091 [Burkholderia diffusa]